PAVEMTADEEDRRFGVAPGNLGDDIARLAVFAALADQSQVHDDGLAAIEDTDQLLGIRDRKRASRDRFRPIGEILNSGVRVAVVVGADRADDDPDRSLQRGNRRPLPPGSAELSIARAVLR